MISIHRKAIGENIANKVAYGWESYKCFDINKLAQVITKYPWSPIVWQGGRRKKSNFIAAYWFVLDFDETMSLEEAMNIFCDCQHIIGITKNHRKPKNGIVADRFRVVIPFDRVVTDIGLFEGNMNAFVKRYDSDPACKAGAQFYYPCTDIISIEPDGYNQELLDIQSNSSVSRVSDGQLKKIYQNKPIPNYIRRAIKYGFVSGERNASWFRICAELSRYGYDKEFCRRIISERQRDRHDFTDSEINRIIDQAFKYKNIVKEQEAKHS